MCLTNIKNIYDIYYPRNLDNFHNKTNSILVKNGHTGKINFNLVFQRFQQNKLCQYHAKHVHHYETGTRSLPKKPDVRRISVFVLLFFLSLAAFDIQYFAMLKFQSTSHVLLT